MRHRQIRQRVQSYLAFACVLLASTSAEAKEPKKQVRISVVDVAGKQIYIRPGASAGIRAGQRVRLGKRRFLVTGVTKETATLALGSHVPKLGAKGSASVALEGRKEPGIVAPAPLESYRGTWKAAVKPARTQSPKGIPIAVSRVGGPIKVVLSAQGSAILPSSSQADPIARVATRAQVHVSPFRGAPLGLDADVEVGKWFGRGLKTGAGSGSRPLIEVQELQLRYGRPGALGFGAGRLRYAAATIGLLDGVRVEQPLGSFSVFGFGGVVPDALDGRPSTELARYGGGIEFRPLDNEYRPYLELSAYASSFDGSLDERRISSSAQIFPGDLSLAAHSEVSLFSPDNPWGASKVELTSAALDARYSRGSFSTALGLSEMQPERSRWLASLLPPSWLCTAEVAAGPGPELCNGSRDFRYFALLTSSYQLGLNTLRAGVSSTAIEKKEIEQVAMFVDLLLELPQASALELSVLTSDAPMLRTLATRVSVSHLFFNQLDASVYYRPAWNDYVASLGRTLEHRVGGELGYSISPRMMVHTSLESLTTEEIGYLAGFVTLVWRALP